MTTKLIKRFQIQKPLFAGTILAALLAVAFATLPAAAQTIFWGVPTTISGDTDVSTLGTPLYAYTGGSGGAVNGVTFTGSTSTTAWGSVGLSGVNANTTTAYASASNPFNSLSSTYKGILQGGDYQSAASGTTTTVTLNGLTSGERYLVQIWLNDSRGTGRFATTSGNGVALLYCAGATAGNVGQYALGYFIATGTSATFTLTASATGAQQLNAIQVRDLGTATLSSGTWTQTGTGVQNWGAAGNWSGSTIAEGNASIANFNTLDVPTTDLNPQLDQPRVINSLTFGDTATATAGNWLLSGASTLFNFLVLDGTTPTITVNALGGSKVATISAAIYGNQGLTKAGAGTLTLTGNNAYTGATTVSAGTLTIGSGSAGNLSPSSALTVASGATLRANNYNVWGGTTANIAAWTIAGTINNVQNFNSQTMPASVTLNNGTMNGAVLTTFGSFFGSSAVTITANGNANAISGANMAAVGGLAFNTPLATDALAISGYLGGTGASGFPVTKSGLGTLTLSGANIYTGTTTVNGGSLILSANNGSLYGTSPYSPLTLGGGTFIYDNTGAGSLRLQNMSALTPNAGANTVQLNRTAAQTTSLTFSSLAARALGSTINFVYGGTPGTIGTDSAINLTGQALGFINGGSYVNGADFAYVNALGTYVRAPVYGGSDTGFNAASATLVSSVHNLLNGNASASASVSPTSIKVATGTSISISLSGSANLQCNNWLVTGGSTLTVSPSSGNIRSSANSEMIVRADTASDNVRFGFIFETGTGSKITKTGAGTLTLSGGCNNAGAMNVNQGTLLVTGGSSGTGALTVMNGAILGGSGTVNNSTVTLNSGGIIMGGTATNFGTLTLSSATAGALTLQGNNTLTFKLSAGAQDKIALTGAGSTVVANGPVNVALSLSGFVPAGTYNLITTLAGSSGSGTYSLVGNYPNCSLAWSGNNLVLTVSGNGIVTGSAPAYDNFDGYTTAANLNGSSAGAGWSGAWASVENTGFAADATSIGTVSTMVSASPNEKATANAAGAQSTKRSFTAITSGNIYVSGLVRVTGTISGSDVSFGGLQLYSGSTELFLFGKAYQQTAWGYNVTAGSGGGGTAVTGNTSKSITSGTTVLIVGKIDATNKKLSMWVNPDLTKLETDNTPDINAISLGSGAISVDTLYLRCGNNSTHVWQFDNVSVGANSPFSPLLPQAPSTPTVSFGCGQLTVNWTAVPGATSYKVYKKINGGAYDSGTTVASGTTYNDNAANNSANTYVYSVSAVNGNGEGAKSADSISVSPNAVPLSTITAPASVCASSTGNTASVPTTSGALYTWSITGGSITAGTGTSQITFTANASGSVVLNCTVTSAAGCTSGGTQNTSVTINTLSAINTQPASQTRAVGNNVTFTVVASGGSPAATYQWQKDAVNISGANNSSYTINNVQTTDAASAPGYSCVVSNGACFQTSSAATLSVNVVPTISGGGQPVSASVCSGSSASFTNTPTTGASTASYQWRQRNAGWGSAGWVLTGAVVNQAGAFVGSATNNNATTSPTDSNLDGDINTAGRAWAMFANSSQTMNAERLSSNNLAIGQTVQLDLDTGAIQSGASAGFSLKAGSNIRFEFIADGTSATYKLTDSSGVAAVATSVPLTKEGVRVTFTLTAANTYSVSFTTLVDGVVRGPFTGTLASSGSIDRIRVYNFNSGPNSGSDLFFNNLTFGNNSDNAADTAYNGGLTGGSNGGGLNLSTGGNINITSDATKSILTVNPAAASASYDVVVSASGAPSVTSSAATLTVNANPSITTAAGALASGTVDNAGYSQIISASGATGFTATGLPGGLSINGSSGVISGTPNEAGVFSSVVVTATNASGCSDTKTYSITINQANSTVTYTGTSFTYNGSAQSPTINITGSTGSQTTNYVGTGYDSVNAPTNAGSYYVSNTVAADANYNGVTNSQTFTINPASTTMVLASDNNPALPGANVTFTATVSSGAGTPTGSVTFKDGISALGTGSLNGSAQAAFSTTSLAHGNHTITVEYGGVGNFSGSTNSPALTQVINIPPVAGSKAYGVAQGETITIVVASGAKSLATDADGDPLTVTSLGDTNAVDFGTASITGGGGSITYANTSGSAGSAALFSYIVSDGYGGLATNSITIRLDPATGANLISATAGDGNAYLTYAGIPGTNYALDHATSITPPINWAQEELKPAGGDGTLRFTNLLSSWPTNDFYRTRYVP